MYKAYVTTLTNVRKHPNADRLMLADCFGNTICVGIDAKDGDAGIYFPSDGQLSEAYCVANDLVRRKDENGNNAGGYLEPGKRNIKPIKLRGEKSDGLFMPLESLAFTGVDINSFSVGDTITVVNGVEICTKYIPRSNSHTHTRCSSKNKISKKEIAPLFKEHADTEQLAYNLADFKLGDQIEITLKMHGTSQRTGYLPVFKGYKRSFWDKITRKVGTPIYDWDYISGTRRTIIDNSNGGFYDTHDFRDNCAIKFEGKLWKGETVYYEVVGFADNNTPIMPSVSNKVVNDKEFIKKYGEKTEFSYGCSVTGKKTVYGVDENGPFSIEQEVPKTDFYVYRMTMTNEDGEVVEYTPDFMRYRCEQMGVKTVPVFEKFYIKEPDDWTKEEFNAGEFVKKIAEEYYDNADPIGKTHIREGVVVRIVNRPSFSAYKHKNWYFKCIEGLVKSDATAPDMEEAEEFNKE